MTSSAPKKLKFLDRLADENGVAVVIVNAESREVAAANNNSMCRSLYPSAEFGPSCAEYCGKAFEAAASAGKAVEYVCYAGLTCRALTVSNAGKQFVAIVGRTFLSADNYRHATEKAITGEWKQFKPTEFFENILISGSDQNIDKAIAGLEKFSSHQRNDILDVDPSRRQEPKTAEASIVEIQPPVSNGSSDIASPIDKSNREFEKEAASQRPPLEVKPPAQTMQNIAEWRSTLGSLMSSTYREACSSILEYLRDRYGFDSLVWLERRDDRLESLVSIGQLGERAVKIGIAADNEKLLEAAKSETPLVLRERTDNDAGKSARTLYLFPVIVGDDSRGAIGVESELEDIGQKHLISRFAQTVASQLEILRLRDEVSKRDWLARAVKRFNESLKKIDADDFWLQVTQISAELLRAERASILIRNDKSNNLEAKAAIGARVNLFSETSVGDRIARPALAAGDPVVVADIHGIGIGSAPVEWNYKTDSFISYPILSGERRIGVLNFTDKAGGDAFDEQDLELLRAIAPQIAVAIDRTTLKDKAGEYEQLSVTDALTGLLNRRYIEERLAEEITRSKRHRFSMSFMMLDVDSFKSYNDSHGHPAGDIALKIVADVLKETLRGADVAARYGGEEFAILLPQTSIEVAAQIAERLRQRIERTQFPKRNVTVSIGIAGCSAEMDTPKDIVSAADVALYQAKNRGRNNVQVFSNHVDSITDRIA